MADEREDAPIVIGCFDTRMLEVSLCQLRHAVRVLAVRLVERGLGVGDTVCLVRLPRTSEVLCAVAYAALSASGLRVLVPMYVELGRFEEWLRLAQAKAVLWSATEVEEVESHEVDRVQLRLLGQVLEKLELPSYCLVRDLGVLGLLEEKPPAVAGERPCQPPIAPALERECLLLTTSGSSGQAKLVRYRQEAILRSCASWEAAGLFHAQLQGGRGLCMLFAHSMGIRAFWNAVWTRQPVCFITPEWFIDHPHRVRALLLNMRPEHITGGPAVFRALLELMRVFPDLKGPILRHLRCAVSTGAPFDPVMARRVEVALGVELANAFGMTETMQVCSTLLDRSAGRAPDRLGVPLPGVRIGLAHVEGQGGLFRMFVSSPFACAGYVGGEGDARGPTGTPEWLATGDLVADTPAGLCFAGRESLDFVKDGFGAKVPLARVAGWYAGLGDPVLDVLCAPLREEPGLAALVYVHPEEASAADGRIGDRIEARGVLDRVRSLLEARHEQLHAQLEDFEFRHFTVGRFACVAGEPPRTAKGNIDRLAAVRASGERLDQLTGRYTRAKGIVLLDREKFARTSFVRLVSPRRGELMRLARLDKHYLRGKGDRLYHSDRGREVEVVDFAGGFGANLLGHRHPDVLAAATEFAAGEGVFLLDQGSARLHEGELARRLALEVGKVTGGQYVVRLGSTGAEAVEMAIVHAMLEREERWRHLRRDLRRRFGGTHPELVAEIITDNEERLRNTRPRILAIRGAFHGHSLGARAVLSNTAKRAPFAPLMGLDAIFLPPGGEVDLEAIVAREALPLRTLARRERSVIETTAPFSGILAAMAEPVLGEGGVLEVSPSLLARLARMPFPLVLDEIQSGLGRTGSFLASEGVVGAYYLFSKALGGGIAKISALLVERSRYVPRFEELYSSTFSGDAHSCAVATRVLEVLAREDIAARAQERGAVLRRALEEVQRAHPGVIRQVRGRGLLLGVELDPQGIFGEFLGRAMVDRDLYGVLAAAYLLNRHRVRVLPTLSAPNVLRIEPSAYVDDAAIEQLRAGLAGFCRAVRERRTDQLLSFLVEDEHALTFSSAPEADVPRMPSDLQAAAPGAVRVAFLSHFIFPERELAMIEPSLGRLSVTARRALFQRLVPLLELKPIPVFAHNLFGGRVHFTSIALPADVSLLQELHRMGYRRQETERIQEAVDLAARQGCAVVSLGAYTSILTRDGTALAAPPGLRITSGNSFTVAVGARRLKRACERAAIDPAGSGTRLALLGATGNIGRGLAHRLLGPGGEFRRALLLGRSPRRLERLREEILGHRAGLEVDTATEVTSLKDMDVIAIATNSNDPLVYPHHLTPGRPVLIVDISVPSAVAPEVRGMRHVRVVPLSGTVAMPEDPGFVISSHTLPGTTFACAAEAMLLALDPAAAQGLVLTGDIDPASVEALERIADRHHLLDEVGDLEGWS